MRVKQDENKSVSNIITTNTEVVLNMQEVEKFSIHSVYTDETPEGVEVAIENAVGGSFEGSVAGAEDLVISADELGIATNITLENDYVAAVASQYDGQVAGMTTDVVIDADVAGAAGDVTLTADSESDIDTLIAAHNVSNPSNALTLSSGDGTQIPTADITLSGGADATGSTVAELIAAWNLANAANAVTLDSGTSTQVPQEDIILSGGYDSVFTVEEHGLTTGLKVQFTTTDTLPAALALTTDYFIIVINEDTFKVASSLSNALDGTSISVVDAGTGTHTCTPEDLAGASVKTQYSNDNVNWIDKDSAVNITEDGDTFFSDSAPVYKYYRLYFAITAGRISVNNYVYASGTNQM